VIYILKVGLITADEVMYAGGMWNTNNDLYYLYNGMNYWTMSPYEWYSAGKNAIVFLVLKGNLTSNGGGVSNTALGLRSVINLRSDVSFSSGNGLQDSPFIVS